MLDVTKFQGVFPAFYACYDEQGEISAERTQALAKHLSVTEAESIRLFSKN